MAKAKATRTISEVFEEFLADQKARVSHKTYLKYWNIIRLYRSYLESCWPGHEHGEYSRITRAGGTFCGTFGPEEITEGYSEFLGYFMPRKVMCGKETMQAAGTVTKKLAKWLTEKGYTEDSSDAEELAGEAARNLPDAREVLDLLDTYLDAHTPARYSGEVSDHFRVTKIEPGKLWLKPFTTNGGRTMGPIPVPKKVTKLCEPMWDIGGVVAKTAGGWRFIEVWNVSP